jgi:hypothetical protein
MPKLLLLECNLISMIQTWHYVNLNVIVMVHQTVSNDQSSNGRNPTAW